jgi:hypothetical protein
LILNEEIFNNNHWNIEFYSGIYNSFSSNDVNLWEILMNKKVKIFKLKNLEFIKSKKGKVKGKLQNVNIFKIYLW